MTQSKFGSVWKHLMIFWHSYIQRFFWSSFSNLGTNFVQTFHMPSFSLIIFQTFSFFISSRLSIIWTVNQPSLHTTALPIQCWYQSCLLKVSYSWSHLFTSSHSTLNLLCHSKHICTAWCYFHILAETLQFFVMEFYPTRPKISGLSVTQYT